MLTKFKFQSVKDDWAGVSKRKQQQVIDMHRLFLYLSLYKQKLNKGADEQNFGDQLLSQADELGFSGQHSAVQGHLRDQLLAISRACHECLREAGDPLHAASNFQWQQRSADSGSRWESSPPAVPSSPTSPSHSAGADRSNEVMQRHGSRFAAPDVPAGAATETPGRGLMLAVGGRPHEPTANPPPADRITPRDMPCGSSIQQRELSKGIRARLGFTLRVQPSQIRHSEAGQRGWMSINITQLDDVTSVNLYRVV